LSINKGLILNKKWIISYCLWIIISFTIFNFYFYEILNFNAKLRNFLVNGSFAIQKVREDGIPVSYSPRLGSFISPFYVVNYGIYYSEILIEKGVIKRKNSYCWKKDKSLDLWPFFIEEDKITLEKFKNTADWIIYNVKSIYGNSHLIYNFNWPYEKYKYKVIRAPWWSGLTDAHAIILLLRAYDVFGKKEYLNVAKLLYKSTKRKIEYGGSLTYLNKFPWIEEYVDYNHPNETPRVLNGMIYSYFGLKCFEERYVPQNERINRELLKSIERNLNVFNLGFWSYYDAIGTIANVKYHKIHVYLLRQLQEEGLTIYYDIKWYVGYYIPILWLFYSNLSYSKIQVLLELIFILILPLFFVFFWRKWKS